MKVVGSISYTKKKEIGVGQGAHSKVYLADDSQLGGEVAAKEIEKSHFPNPVTYFEEAQMMFAVAHDNVVAVQYACETPTTISLVMPYYQNGSLGDRIKDRPLQLSEVQRVAQGVLAGLAHIHLRGYIHFDVKPSNVLFSDMNRPLVADFGQSREISMTGVVTVPGLYRNAQPPETVTTGTATMLADIYHVGLLMYRALNGNPFYESQIPSHPALLRAQICKGKCPDRKHFMPHVPSRLRTLVRKALRVKPEERFQTATEMADALSRVSLDLDWSVEPILLGGTRWRASRPGYCDLIVELIERTGSWGVEMFTQQPNEVRRRKYRRKDWKDGLGLDDANAYLEDVFETISE